MDRPKPTSGRSIFKPEKPDNIRYLNLQAGVPRSWYGEKNAVPDTTLALAVELQQGENEDGTVNVRSMGTGSAVFACGENGAMIFSADADETFQVRPEDLSEDPIFEFREKEEADMAWDMPYEERKPYEDIWSKHKGMSAERAGEIFDQIEEFGIESVPAEMQDLGSMDRDKMMQVGAFMYQCGRMDENTTGAYSSYERSDTGRYLQIETADKPGVLINVYEAPPSGVRHQFWNMEPGEGKWGFNSFEEGEFEVKGIYAGQPYQAQREQSAEIRRQSSVMTQRAMEDAAKPKQSAYAQMQAAVAGMDGEDPGPGESQDYGLGED